jgi:hypothetical protein
MDHLVDWWLSIKDYYAYLGISDDMAYRRITSHNMPICKIECLWKFKINEIE